MSSPWAPPPPTSSAKASSQVQPKGQSAQSTTTTGSRCSAGGSENAAPLTPTPTVTPQNVDVSGLHLEEGDTTTTVAIGQDTYTIGKKINS